MNDRIEAIVGDMKAVGMLVDPLKTALVAGYQAGDVQKTAFYAAVRGEDARPAYLAEFRCAAADLIMQLRVLLHYYGGDFSSLVRLGEERLYERIEDIKKGRLPRPDESLAGMTER